jgi:hypothetical protein
MHTQSPSQWKLGEPDPSSSEVKKEWSHISTLIDLYVVHRDSFTSYLLQWLSIFH